MFRLFRRDRERGAAAVEFAIILPIFVLLIFGTMETGWFFAQQVEIRNAAREGARLAVVDYASADPQTTPGTVAYETINRSDLSGPGATVTICMINGPDGDEFSDDAVSVTVAKTYASLTGVFDFFDGEMSSEAVMRVERPLSKLGAGGC